ncbi:helix-turn-helix domain-containing protein [Corynebacterium hindlerae]|nr:helix-turn-helix transcriptional regulator [Corynebacterium hindlerae]
MSAPVELYPEWPRRECRRNQVHERVRLAALKLKDFIDTSTELGSINKVADKCKMPRSTVGDFLAGRCWPSALTIAQLEVGLNIDLGAGDTGLQYEFTLDDPPTMDELCDTIFGDLDK